MSLVPIADRVYVQRHPLNLLGCRMGRVVTVLQLESGRTLIHTTAGFSDTDASGIRELGEPSCLLEATNFHDTMAESARSIFTDVPYFVPRGFSKQDRLGAKDIGALNMDGEVKIIPVKGMPKLNEYAVFHEPSKTLILADLFFNLPDSVGSWTKWFLKTAFGLKVFPGQSALFRKFIEDQDAYRDSVDEIASLDFDRIIVGHGDPVVKDADSIFRKVLLDS